MPLLEAWKRRLAELPETNGETESCRFVVPCSARYYAEKLNYVSTEAEVKAIVELARQRSIGWIGVDTEFRYDRPGIPINQREVVYDPRSLRPLLMSLALAEPDGSNGGKLYRFVIDLRVEPVCRSLKPLLQLPICFVGHCLQAEILCLLRLGLPEPRLVWDTWVHERARYLGIYHKRYGHRAGMDDIDRLVTDIESEEQDRIRYSLPATCHRYGVSYSFAGDKQRLQESFLDHADDAPFSSEQIEYSAVDAVAAAALYSCQVNAATCGGYLQHLVNVEMPWIATNARMVWRGVKIDAAKCSRMTEACHGHLEQLGPELETVGITNVKSHPQLKQFFARVGLLDLFKKGGKYSFDKNQLECFQDRHHVIPLIRTVIKARDLLSEKILSGELVGADGRVHPEYCHIGTHTGRQSSRRPNILGLGRVFRPLIVPEPGRGIGEVDLCQIEVGIAAAVYGDERLVEMFNTGDVYAAAAMEYYRNQLPEEDQGLSVHEFKKRHPQHRNKMKPCILGIIYGLTPYGLARDLNISIHEAKTLHSQFMKMFPALRETQSDNLQFAALKGYSSTFSGLHRHRGGGSGPLSNWERNWMNNHPVQGSAAVVFKMAGNRLDKLYRCYDAWLIVPLHDAYVFEAPLDVLGKVAELTGRVMCEAVRESFPQLYPRVEVNIDHPECWNKDGHADSIDRWIEDPTFSF